MTKTNEAARVLQQRVIEVVYDLFTPGTETQFSIDAVAEVEDFGANRGQLGHAFTVIEDLGIIKRERRGIPGQTGRRSFITLIAENKEAALAMLKARPLRAKAKPKAKAIKAEAVKMAAAIEVPSDGVTISEKEGEEVRAIAGPEAPGQFEVLRALRKNESAALLEAARQYRDREQALERAMAELRTQGIKIRYAVDWERNELLEQIGQILPYIDGMERTAENALRHLDSKNREIRELNQTIEGLRRELRRHQPQATVVGAER